MVHDAKHRCLKHLSLNDWRNNSDDRLPRKRNLSLTHSINAARKLHVCEITSDLSVFLPRKKLLEKLLIRAAKPLNHLYNLSNTTYHRPIVCVGSLPVK